MHSYAIGGFDRAWQATPVIVKLGGNVAVKPCNLLFEAWRDTKISDLRHVTGTNDLLEMVDLSATRDQEVSQVSIYPFELESN